MPSVLTDSDFDRIHDIVAAAVAPVANDVVRHNRILDGNGQPGLVQRVTELEVEPRSSFRDRAVNVGVPSLVASIVAGVIAGLGGHR